MEIVASLCQALVLTCFNAQDGESEDPKLTILEIMKRTGLEDRMEVERVISSMTFGRDGTNVLCRVEEKSMNEEDMTSTPKKKHKTMRKSISDSDQFMYNANFSNNCRKIRLPNVQSTNNTKERSKTQQSVMMDRLYLVDAAIVRIMKARKTLDHRTLVGEVMKQLDFPLSGTDVKKQIEKLIEREYMERVDNARYNYLA